MPASSRSPSFVDLRNVHGPLLVRGGHAYLFSPFPLRRGGGGEGEKG